MSPDCSSLCLYALIHVIVKALPQKWVTMTHKLQKLTLHSLDTHTDHQTPQQKSLGLV